MSHSIELIHIVLEHSSNSSGPEAFLEPEFGWE